MGEGKFDAFDPVQLRRNLLQASLVVQIININVNFCTYFTKIDFFLGN